MLRVVFELCAAFLAVWGWYRLLTDRSRRSRFFSGGGETVRVWLYDAESAEFRLRRALSEASCGSTVCVYLCRENMEIRKIAEAFSGQYPNMRIILTENEEV